MEKEMVTQNCPTKARRLRITRYYSLLFYRLVYPLPPFKISKQFFEHSLFFSEFLAPLGEFRAYFLCSQGKIFGPLFTEIDVTWSFFNQNWPKTISLQSQLHSASWHHFQ